MASRMRKEVEAKGQIKIARLMASGWVRGGTGGIGALGALGMGLRNLVGVRLGGVVISLGGFYIYFILKTEIYDRLHQVYEKLLPTRLYRHFCKVIHRPLCNKIVARCYFNKRRKLFFASPVG